MCFPIVMTYPLRRHLISHTSLIGWTLAAAALRATRLRRMVGVSSAHSRLLWNDRLRPTGWRRDRWWRHGERSTSWS
jgi:hypothetical protein